MRGFRLLLVAFGASLVLAQSPKYTTCVSNEQMRHYQTVADPQLSPDGSQVVYVQRESTADGAASHVWLVGTRAGSQPRQITFSPAGDKSGESAPAWMPDGSALLFIAHRGDARQVYRLPLQGGDAAPLEIKVRDASGDEQPLSIGSFAISPDGRYLAIHASVPATARQKRDQTDKKDARFEGRELHPQRLWIYTLAGGAITAINLGGRDPRSIAWSPDSRELAVIAAPRGNADDLGPANRLELVDVSDPSQIHTVGGVPPSSGNVSFSPDGRTIALSAQTDHDAPPGISAIYAVPTAGGPVRDLSDAAALDVSGRAMIWSADGATLYVGAQHGTSGGLGAITLASADPRWIAPELPDASSFSTNQRHTGWVFLAQSTRQLPQVAYAPTPEAQPVILSRANSDWPSTGWSAAEPVSWKAPDGMSIHGLYFPPSSAVCSGASAPAAGKTPLIVMVHGGPTGAFLQSFSPLVQFFTSQGWAVLEPNPRGSTGYGWQFAAANKNDLGDKDFQDVMAGLDWALAHRPIDPHRLGLYGYSYGGEMAGFIEGKTARFAAIVAGAPVIDQYSEYGTENGSWYDRWFFGRPWLRPQDAWRQSPLSYARNARTPLLLLQGEADTTDPMGQSEEEYRALHQMGVPVRLMLFPRENHGPLSGGISGYPSPEPWHGFQARSQILAWYNRYFNNSGTSAAGMRR